MLSEAHYKIGDTIYLDDHQTKSSRIFGGKAKICGIKRHRQAYFNLCQLEGFLTHYSFSEKWLLLQVQGRLKRKFGNKPAKLIEFKLPD